MKNKKKGLFAKLFSPLNKFASCITIKLYLKFIFGTSIIGLLMLFLGFIINFGNQVWQDNYGSRLFLAAGLVFGLFVILRVLNNSCPDEEEDSVKIRKEKGIRKKWF